MSPKQSRDSFPVASVSSCPFCPGKLKREGMLGRLVIMRCQSCRAKVTKARLK